MKKPLNKIQYDPVAKTLHWLIALAIIGMLALGWIMQALPNGPDKFSLFQWHKSVGITIMLLAVARLLWRWRHPPPSLPLSMPRWEKTAAHAGHILLYVLMIAMPFVGWVIVSASPMNLPTILYGCVPWPHLPFLPEMANKGEIGHGAAKVHGYLAWMIVAVASGHFIAALKHHFIDRDNVLTRMMPQFLNGFLNRMRGLK